MITKRKEAFDFIEQRNDLLDGKDAVRVSAMAMLRYRHGGGVFDIDRELLSFLHMLKGMGRDTVVLLDSIGNPIEIEDVGSFMEECFSRYFEATNMYRVEYKRISDDAASKSVADFSEFK